MTWWFYRLTLRKDQEDEINDDRDSQFFNYLEGMEFRVRMVLGQDLGMTERQGFGHGRLLRLAMVCMMVRAVSLGLRSVGLERKGVRVGSGQGECAVLEDRGPVGMDGSFIEFCRVLVGRLVKLIS